MSRGFVEFEIADVKFRSTPLKPEVSLKVLDLLIETILPMISAAIEEEVDIEQAAKKLAGAAVRLPEVYQAFAEHCHWQRDGKWVAVKLFPDVFARRPSLLLAWLSTSIREEFGDFLHEDGQNLLASEGSHWNSLLGSIGGSGE